MTETKPVAPDGDEQLLEWPNKDNRRFVRAVYRVGDLDRTIKFYTECLGMELLRKYEVSNEKHTKAIMGFGPEESSFVLELTYEDGVTSYDIGTGFGHFAIATQDVYKMVENVRAKGGENMIIREPFELKGSPVLLLAYVKDPNGYIFELIQRGQTPQPLCHLMLRVADLQRSIDFYRKALGMRVLTKVESLEQKYAIALMGYADELETTAVELTYNHGVTQHSKGNGYSQVAIGTDDVYKSAEIVNLITKKLGGKITQPPSLDSQMNSKIISFLDPDGWQIVLVDNEDYLKGMQ
ncbi:putative lactoylglutathione lyase [Cucumis melo var. makuwa]|uniref:Lactoylglutathione lyase n=3 Tax=Cucumis melo TaxID=3656 RepID=A0A5D3BI05_CUCMM|nr:lactoylglutathione lyase [Cucumis melo subsp. melo]KAA0056849.1 putative lactoylglutathione lyase [Cucumis melo var. makuwa]TYJ99352.1 putative lactoylglutathione lyase [Cucumis melo var. makuwa]